MAGMTVDGQCLKFNTVYEDEILFEDVQDFMRIDKCWIRMILDDKRFLVVDEECLRFEERTTPESRKEDCLFNIYCYSNSESGKAEGLPVTLTVSCNGKNRMICSRVNGNGKSVYAKQQDLPLPKYIEGSKHEAVFFLQKVKEQQKYYRIESSLWPKWFLSFEDESGGVVKLVLREAGDDVVDGFYLLKP